MRVVVSGGMEEEFNENDLLLAMGTGAVLGGSIGVRRKVTGESYGRAIGQVVAGAGLNVAATAIGSSEPSDLYTAALVGGVATPIVGWSEKRFSNYEPLVNALIGSLATSGQYSASQHLKGEPIDQDKLVYNILGGFIGAGGFKSSVKHFSPNKYRTLDDFIVTGGGTFTGGFLIPDTLSKLQASIEEN